MGKYSVDHCDHNRQNKCQKNLRFRSPTSQTANQGHKRKATDEELDELDRKWDKAEVERSKLEAHSHLPGKQSGFVMHLFFYGLTLEQISYRANIKSPSDYINKSLAAFTEVSQHIWNIHLETEFQKRAQALDPNIFTSDRPLSELMQALSCSDDHAKLARFFMLMSAAADRRGTNLSESRDCEGTDQVP